MDIELYEIGQRVRKARLLKHMSQAQLAEASDLSASFISNLETGKQAMNIRSLIAISNALNVSADWLLKNEAAYAVHEAALEIEKELSSCTARERGMILELIQVLKKSIAILKKDGE